MAPFIRGGVWTNVEDEILRAAISKYGLNQWSRVSSLLARKTAKQCKARWNEWLDPSVKKIEWSREEDEKLLHLAKIMPTQWRTIAPIVGRTASQCIERYQKLLDDAEQKDSTLSLTGVGAESQASSGSRRWRAGDIDPTPETKPARPDAIDMDEDELEMLSEARARLANTQGKKAKRKDRERLLEESRRLALLQKRRELKQAGINTRLGKKKKNEMDYNADIPFEHKPAVGFYSTSEEQDANEAAKLQFRRKKFSNELPENNKKDKKRDRFENKESAAQKASQMRSEKLLEMQEADQALKRRKLILPSPQVEDSEFESIAKMGSRGDEIKEKYSGTDTVTSALIGDYQSTPLPQPTRVSQATAPNEDRIYQATKEALMMTGNQVSLLSNEADEWNEADSKDPFAKPDKLGSNKLGKNLPMTTETPRRDGLGVNQLEIGATPSEVLRRSFMSLPKPKNDFEIVLPEGGQTDSIISDLDSGAEDLGERKRADEKAKKEAYERSMVRRSETLKRELPRPVSVVDTPPPIIGYVDEYAHASSMIDSEMRDLINSDYTKYPLEKNTNDRSNPPAINELDEHIKASAQAEIDSEFEKVAHKEHILSQSLKIYETELNDLLETDGEENTIQGDKKQYESITMPLITHLSSLAQSANKQEDKLSVLFAGYIKRHEMLSKKLAEKFELLNEKKISKNVFSQLKDMEDIALRTRFDSLQEEVEFLTTSERNGQLRYKDLQDIKSSLV